MYVTQLETEAGSHVLFFLFQGPSFPLPAPRPPQTFVYGRKCLGMWFRD